MNWIEETRSQLDELETIYENATYAEISSLIEDVIGSANDIDCQIADCPESEENKQNCEKVYLDLVKIIPEGNWQLYKDYLDFHFKPSRWNDSQAHCIFFRFYGGSINMSLRGGALDSYTLNASEILGNYPDIRVDLTEDRTNCYDKLLKVANYWIEEYPYQDIINTYMASGATYKLYRKYIGKLYKDISISGKWRTIIPSEGFIYELKFTPDTWSNYEIKFLFNETDSTITYLLQMQKGVDTPSNWIELNEKYTIKYENKSIFTGELKPCDFYSEFEKNVADFIKMVEAGEQIENC